MNEIIKILAKLDGGTVLDAASGRGEFINTLKQHLKSYAQIIGVDSSERSVDYAQKLFPENDIEIFRMNLEQLQFADNYFDMVCISNSLHHLENIDAVLKQLIRVLKPGGYFLMTEMYSDGTQSPAQETHIIMHHWLSSADRLCGTYHRNTYTKSELEEIAAALPLKNMQIVDFYVPVDNAKINCETLVRNCKETIKRLENITDSESLVAEGHLVLQRLAEIGCASASRLLITAIKPA